VVRLRLEQGLLRCHQRTNSASAPAVSTPAMRVCGATRARWPSRQRRLQCCSICSNTRETWLPKMRDIMVSDGALKVCIAEIRQTLGDDRRTPQFIKTEHRRGYRFIATVAQSPVAAASQPSSMGSAPAPDPGPWPRKARAQKGWQSSGGVWRRTRRRAPTTIGRIGWRS
jgi:hypothetical protein